MPTSSKNHRRSQEEKARIERLAEKSASFHGRSPANMALLRRPKTESDLLSGRKLTGIPLETPPQPTKLLLNVTVQRSLGAVQVVISLESRVGDLVAAAVRQYVKEGRRPFLPSTDPSGFDLHYSQFSLESLDREEKLITLGSRNFFLFPSKVTVTTCSSSTSCSNQVEKASKNGPPWFNRFMDFLL